MVNSGHRAKDYKNGNPFRQWTKKRKKRRGSHQFQYPYEMTNGLYVFFLSYRGVCVRERDRTSCLLTFSASEMSSLSPEAMADQHNNNNNKGSKFPFGILFLLLVPFHKERIQSNSKSGRQKLSDYFNLCFTSKFFCFLLRLLSM